MFLGDEEARHNIKILMFPGERIRNGGFGGNGALSLKHAHSGTIWFGASQAA